MRFDTSTNTSTNTGNARSLKKKGVFFFWKRKIPFQVVILFFGFDLNWSLYLLFWNNLSWFVSDGSCSIVRINFIPTSRDPVRQGSLVYSVVVNICQHDLISGNCRWFFIVFDNSPSLWFTRNDWGSISLYIVHFIVLIIHFHLKISSHFSKITLLPGSLILVWSMCF